MSKALFKISLVSLLAVLASALGVLLAKNFYFTDKAQARVDGNECIVFNTEPKLSFATPGGTEFAFINSGGYFGFNGDLITQETQEGQVVDIETERQWGYGCIDFGDDGDFDNDYYDYRINNANGITAMAVVFCRENSATKVFVRNGIFEVRIDVQGQAVMNRLSLDSSNQLLVLNSQGSIVAGIDNLDGNNLVLAGCYEDQFIF